MSGQMQIKVFAGTASQGFAMDICQRLGTELGKADVRKFSDGNIFVRILEQVRDKDVYVIQTIGIQPNDGFMELLFWIDALKRASAGSITAVIPYFSYAKGDKKDEPRVSIRARVCADCLETAGVDRVITMDLHAPQIQGFFKKPVDHLYALPVLCDAILQRGLPNLTVVSPDAGFTKRAREFAHRLKAPVAIGDKMRSDHTESAEIMSLIGDVAGRNVVIVDDFSVSCGTLVQMAKTVKAHGAKRVLACVTHGLLGEEGAKALMESPIEELLVTDTLEQAAGRFCPKITVVSVAELFAKAIKIIHDKESLSILFE